MALMRYPKAGSLAWAVVAAVLSAAPAAADTAASDWTDTELGRIIERKLDRAFEQLGDALEQLPRYSLPEVTEDGDIIIRRLPRRRESWPPPGEPDATIDL